MKIVLFIDKDESAIGRLAYSIQKNLPHHHIRVVAFHPKRPDNIQLQKASEALDWCDLIQVCYWKTGERLRELFPDKFSKPSVVWHNNPYDINKYNWPDLYTVSVVSNGSMHSALPYARLIPLSIDLDFFTFNEELTSERVVNMTVARIEGKKGVLEVARACKELNCRFILVGRVSDGGYMDKVREAAGEYLDFREDVDDEMLKGSYYESMVHVCNSVDNFETGTMPILEAMACGVPVLTRNVGHVPDLNDGKNMVVRTGKEDDYEDLLNNLRDLVENDMYRERIRDAAWETVKNRNCKKMAMQFGKLWGELVYTAGLVSIIIPTRNPTEGFVDTMVAAVTQDYPNTEIIVVDSSDSPIENVVTELRANTDVPIKYVYFTHDGYSLPKARNLGVIEAEGKYLMFCDDRIVMDKHAVTAMVPICVDNVWTWGVKDGSIKSFVENFSMVRKSWFLRHGMFNERIEQYGGATQEIRSRYEGLAGFKFIMADNAMATSNGKSRSKFNSKADVIKSKFTLYKLYG